MEKCVIVDIDGTIALHEKRNPFDVEKIIQDKPNMVIFNLLEILNKSGVSIIFVSARPIETMQATIAWLGCYVKYSYYLYMRDIGDNREDDQVKKSIYQKYLKDKNILFILEDRKKVVDMWRDLGLTCYQVADKE